MFLHYDIKLLRSFRAKLLKLQKLSKVNELRFPGKLITVRISQGNWKTAPYWWRLLVFRIIASDRNLYSLKNTTKVQCLLQFRWTGSLIELFVCFSFRLLYNTSCYSVAHIVGKKKCFSFCFVKVYCHDIFVNLSNFTTQNLFAFFPGKSSVIGVSFKLRWKLSKLWNKNTRKK